MMDFTAIDFETATAARDSACSVAVIEIKDGRLHDSYYTLIKPPGNTYNWFNTKIHGLKARDTATALDFAGIWPELSPYLTGHIVVAHNARFDMSVLSACLDRYQLPHPDFRYCDTVAISRKVWPELENHKLDTVGSYLNFDFHHHNALDDAKACAIIPLRAGRQLATDDLPTLASRLGISVKTFAALRLSARERGVKLQSGRRWHRRLSD